MRPHAIARPAADDTPAAAIHRRAAATGFRELDRELRGGGWPLGDTIEVLSDGNGLGALGLFLPVMARVESSAGNQVRGESWGRLDGEAVRQDGLSGARLNGAGVAGMGGMESGAGNRVRGGSQQAFIAAPCPPCAPLLAARGIDPSQIKQIRPRARQDLLWSIERTLRGGECGAVFAWLGAARYRYRELRKLREAAAHSGALAVLFRPRQAARAPAPSPLRLEMNAYRQVRILKQHGGPQSLNVYLSESNDAPRHPQLWELPAASPPAFPAQQAAAQAARSA